MAVAKVSKLFAELMKVALSNENKLSKNPSIGNPPYERKVISI